MELSVAWTDLDRTKQDGFDQWENYKDENIFLLMQQLGMWVTKLLCFRK